jgi:hypothetical protein
MAGSDEVTLTDFVVLPVEEEPVVLTVSSINARRTPLPADVFWPFCGAGATETPEAGDFGSSPPAYCAPVPSPERPGRDEG